MRRLRALPTIRTCGECPVIGQVAESYGMDGEEYGSVDVCGMRDDLPAVDRDQPPPDACPLKAK